MLNEAPAKPITDKTLKLPADKPIPVKACLIGDRLHLRGLYEPPLALGPLVLPAGESGLVMLFRYGAVAMFNLSAGEQEKCLQELKPRVQEPLAKFESEDTSIFISPPEVDSIITTNGIGLYNFNLSRLKVVAIVLARSVALARYEAAMASAFDLVEPLALHRNVRPASRARRPGRAAGFHLTAPLFDDLLCCPDLSGLARPSTLLKRGDRKTFGEDNHQSTKEAGHASVNLISVSRSSILQSLRRRSSARQVFHRQDRDLDHRLRRQLKNKFFILLGG